MYHGLKTIDVTQKNGFFFTLSAPPAHPPALYFGCLLSSVRFLDWYRIDRFRFLALGGEKDPVWHLWDFEFGAQLLPKWEEVLSRILETLGQTDLHAGIIPAFPEPALPCRFPDCFLPGNGRSDIFILQIILKDTTYH